MSEVKQGRVWVWKNKGDERELISFGALNYVVKNQNCAVVTGFEYENILVFGFLMM